ncbi:MAG: hypothetical protein ABSG91_09095 [Syntrophobacteraceae bacterium]|jgi:hypothetical protein
MAMVLCENEENLKFIKKIDLIQVRRKMKQANPDLFEEFLERIVGGGKLRLRAYPKSGEFSHSK